MALEKGEKDIYQGKYNKTHLTAPILWVQPQNLFNWLHLYNHPLPQKLMDNKFKVNLHFNVKLYLNQLRK